MKVPVSWLREFTDVSASPEDIGHTLSMRGFELGAVEKAGAETVLDFEILANRPDCMSVLGLAREAATAYATPLNPAALKRFDTAPLTANETAPPLKVHLREPQLCPRYAAAVADVNVGPSPDWLATRLQAAGIRPINNVVDVTNYVLLELGQPMHAFDLARLAGGELQIRRAAKGERITTLDGVDRELSPEMLVIADGQQPQAVAGVMGGALSEVSSATKAIVLESAYFHPVSVRRTGRKLGLKTEASTRFERGADVNAPVAGIARALALLSQIGAGTPRDGIVDDYPKPVATPALTLRRSRIGRVLGQMVPDRDVERTLSSLGFSVTAEPTAQHDCQWRVVVPSYRVDVSREVDLIEEVGRYHGYDQLPATFPALTESPPPPDPGLERDKIVRRVLLAAGCSEAVTFSFIAASSAGQFAPLGDLGAIVELSNPLTTQFAVLRPSLLPGLLAAVEHNRHRQRADVCLFEIGAAVTMTGLHHKVAVAWTGDAGGAHWGGVDRAVDFFDVKGLAERVGEALGVDFRFERAAGVSYLTPGRAATVKTGDVDVGAVGHLAQTKDVYCFELDLGAIARAQAASPRGPLTFTPLPRHPSVGRDISIVVDDTLPAATVRGTIQSVAPQTLVSIAEFDRYQGKGVPEGRVSLSLRLTFRSLERTLTDAEVDDAMKQILAALASEHSAVQR